ncbi:MAG TPA: phosphoribosylformylglycinamidine synthase I [Tepidisphaeraceae bacterium]|jgi:phosphoribosylformylglycinamidine synthase|nr:phosphoribosylformylglycinamidine synthase I [Tepidisphaeraceae bacterium]
MKPRALILRSAGTNCDGETAWAFELAGAQTEKVHINRLLGEPGLLDRFQLLAFPGGFSYGDDIAAGKILANQIAHHLADSLRAFVESGRPIIGICNGFQVLVKTDLLPGPLAGRTGQTCTLTHNDSGRFIDRWVHLMPASHKCIWTRGLVGRSMELPIAHGEGKFVTATPAVLKALIAEDQVALRYIRPDGSSADGAFPENPNGSMADIAGVCDSTGLILGLMPHPERHVDPTQHPAWTRRAIEPGAVGGGMTIFQNAVRHVGQAVGAGV